MGKRAGTSTASAAPARVWSLRDIPWDVVRAHIIPCLSARDYNIMRASWKWWRDKTFPLYLGSQCCIVVAEALAQEYHFRKRVKDKKDFDWYCAHWRSKIEDGTTIVYNRKPGLYIIHYRASGASPVRKHVRFEYATPDSYSERMLLRFFRVPESEIKNMVRPDVTVVRYPFSLP